MPNLRQKMNDLSVFEDCKSTYLSRCVIRCKYSFSIAVFGSQVGKAWREISRIAHEAQNTEIVTEEKAFRLESVTKECWHMAVVGGRKNNCFLVHPFSQLIIWLMMLGPLMMGIWLSWSKQRQRPLGLLKPKNSLIPRWLSRQHHHKGSSMKMVFKENSFQDLAWNNCGKENREDRARSVYWKWKGKNNTMLSWVNTEKPSIY